MPRSFIAAKRNRYDVDGCNFCKEYCLPRVLHVSTNSLPLPSSHSRMYCWMCEPLSFGAFQRNCNEFFERAINFGGVGWSGSHDGHVKTAASDGEPLSPSK